MKTINTIYSNQLTKRIKSSALRKRWCRQILLTNIVLLFVVAFATTTVNAQKDGFTNTFNYPDGTEYNKDKCNSDVGLCEYWLNSSHTKIYDNHLEVFLDANVGGTGGGMTGRAKINGAKTYSMEYRVKFVNPQNKLFDFNLGGKLPGLAGGTAPTGGKFADGSGFSTRLMWRANGKLVVYAYWIDKVDGDWGDDWDTGFTFKRNTWQTIKLLVTMNTGNSSTGYKYDGKVELWLDGKYKLVKNNVRLMTRDTKLIDKVYFDTFMGGGWAPIHNEFIHLDDFKVVKGGDNSGGDNAGSGGQSALTGKTKFEAENNYSVVNEVGNKSNIMVDGSSGLASAGKFIRLYDVNDEIKLNFKATTSGRYELRARVRVGESTGTATSLKNAYELYINGVKKIFTLDLGTVSGIDGDTYWGEIVHPQIRLNAGNHDIRIRAKDDWLKVDYIARTKIVNTGNVVVRGRGVSGAEKIRLLVDNKQVGSDIQLKSTLVEYNFDIPNTNANFKVEYFNDLEGRDALIDYIKVDGERSEAEDQTVNTGVWTGTCGGTKSVWLNCNGYIDFGESTAKGNIVVNARGSCGGEKIQLKVNNVSVKTWTLTSNDANYTYSGFSGSSNIKVDFINDGSNSDGCDRNIVVNNIKVCGKTLETNIANRTGCGWNYGLNCNGSFDFGTQSCGGSTGRSGSPQIDDIVEGAGTQDLSIYPNPANEYFIIVSPNDEFVYTLVDIRSRVIATETITGTQKTTVNVSQLNQGVYLLNVKSENKQVVRKILVE